MNHPAGRSPARSATASSFRFGDDDHLVGTLTLPAPADEAAPAAGDGDGGGAAGDGGGVAGRTGVLLMNAGVIHRIGPHRINVKLARHFAAAGLPGLRFDLSGLGDSLRPADARPMAEQALRDMRAAIDCLQRRAGVTRVLMIGDCSAAEYGYLCALADPRVTDLVMIDGYSFGNARTRLLRYTQRLATATPAIWRHAVAGRWQRLIGRRYAAMAGPVDFGLPEVDAVGFARGLIRLVDRGVRVYLLYSGSILHRYNHPDQFADVMLRLPQLDAVQRRQLARVHCEFAPDIDHTMTSLTAQRQLIERIDRWFHAAGPRFSR